MSSHSPHAPIGPSTATSGTASETEAKATRPARHDTNHPSLPLNTDAALQFLEHELDLSELADNLASDPNVLVPADDIDLTLSEYRRFLVLKLVYNDGHALLLSPSAIIDAVWHTHILDMSAYFAMNERLPFWIHHKPKGAWVSDHADRSRRLENVITCYRAQWGELPAAIWVEKSAAELMSQPPTPKTNVLQFFVGQKRQRPSKMTLILVNGQGPNFWVPVSPSYPFLQVKELNHRLGGSPAAATRLHLEGDALWDEWMVAESAVEEGDVVEAIVLQVGC